MHDDVIPVCCCSVFYTGHVVYLVLLFVVGRLSLFYGPSLCLSSSLSHCLCVVCVLCYMGRAACNKSSFVRSILNYYSLLPRGPKVSHYYIIKISY